MDTKRSRSGSSLRFLSAAAVCMGAAAMIFVSGETSRAATVLNNGDQGANNQGAAGVDQNAANQAAGGPAQRAGNQEFVAGEVLLAFRPGVAAAKRDEVRRGLGAARIKEFSRLGIHHWRLPPGLAVADAVRRLSANPNVRFAEPNYIVHAIGTFPNDP